MTIKTGDKMPTGTLGVMTDKGPGQLTSAELFDGKKVVLFSVPGAFTPTCSAKHLPGFLENADKLKAKGVDTIACLAVNDAFEIRYLRASFHQRGAGIIAAISARCQSRLEIARRRNVRNLKHRLGAT